MRESAVRKLDYDEDAGVVVVSFPFDQALNAQLKSELPGMRWDRDGRRWVLPARHAARASEILIQMGFAPTEAFIATLAGSASAPAKGAGGSSAAADAAELPPGARSVAELVARIKRALADAFPGPVWVVGTLLGFDKVAARAARYYPFALADWDETADKPACQLDAVMWPNVFQTLCHKFRGAGVELRDTLPVLFKVSVRVWESAGRLQLYVEDADPSYTVGRILKNLDAVHDRLIQEGIADRNRRLPWPELPLRVGVVTAAKDGFADFQRILSQSGFPFEIHFVESRVQGPETASSVVAALGRLAREKVDCIALVRGGGASADLSWFNDYAIGRAICLCPVPVVAGIGHDRDETLP
ncbi:MAG: exodeoxyribonuclease VII large subunit, partial [Candidatus Sericytochromatia bacterium]|nr:exodeoxyribonuclease VII large subunit [Candidatus Tanganyikabacteria bacterium]